MAEEGATTEPATASPGSCARPSPDTAAPAAAPAASAEAADARLEGARLAARGIAHRVNNDLTGALGNLSVVLLAHPDLPPAARQRVEQAVAYLQRASTH